MRKIWKAIPLFKLMIPIRVLADEAAQSRMDQRMLEAILIFLGYVSWPIIAMAIGLFVLSMRNEDGASKSNSLKIFGVGAFLLCLHSFAKASGLC